MTVKKKAILAAVIIVVTLVVSPFSSCSFFENLEKEEAFISTISYEQLDLSNKENGVYIGEFKLPLKSARVSVVVKNGRLKTIDLLEHSHGPGFSGEGVIKRVLEEQSLEVDAVSGATKSSITILKAIENAIQ